MADYNLGDEHATDMCTDRTDRQTDIQTSVVAVEQVGKVVMYTYIVAYRHGRGGHARGLRRQDDVRQDAVLVHDLLHHVTRGHLHGHGQWWTVVGHHANRGRTCKHTRVTMLLTDTHTHK